MQQGTLFLFGVVEPMGVVADFIDAAWLWVIMAIAFSVAMAKLPDIAQKAESKKSGKR
jgi:hypothetical protein